MGKRAGGIRLAFFLPFLFVTFGRPLSLFLSPAYIWRSPISFLVTPFSPLKSLLHNFSAFNTRSAHLLQTLVCPRHSHCGGVV